LIPPQEPTGNLTTDHQPAPAAAPVPGLSPSSLPRPFKARTSPSDPAAGGLWSSAWLAVGVLAAFTIGLFWRFVFLGQSYLPADILATWYPWKAIEPNRPPHNPLLSDVIDTFYPQDAFFAAQLHQGQIPLWDPSILGGHPSLADGWSAELYPIHLLLAGIFPLHLAHDLDLLLHVFLAGLFSWLLLRQLGVGSFGALIGGLAWMANGYVMVWLEYGHTVAVAALLPLSLWLYEKAVAERRWRWAVLAGVAVGLALLAGSLQRGAYLLLALGGYLVYRALVCYLAERRPQALLWPVGAGALALTLGFALAAAQLLPTLALAGLSQRPVESLAQLFPAPGLRLALLATFLAPGLAGGPTYPIDLYPLALTNANEFQGYAGLLPLLLAGVAIVRRRGPALYFTAMVVLALLLALGTPLYVVLYDLAPDFNKLGPQRILVLYAFGVAMLAGFGADELASGAGVALARRLQRLVLAALALAALGAVALNLAVRLGQAPILAAGRAYVRGHVYGTALNPRSLAAYDAQVVTLYHQLVNLYAPTSPAIYLPFAFGFGCLIVCWLRERRPGLFPAAAVLLIAVDLGSFALGYNTTVDPRTIYPPTPAIHFLQSDHALYRVALNTGAATMFPDTLQPFGIQELGGYESLYSGRVARLLASVQAGEPAASPFGNLALLSQFRSPLLDLLNVKYVLAPPGSPLPGPGFTRVHDGDLAIFENRNVLPRAQVVGQCRVAASSNAALAALFQPGFRPDRTVILEAPASATCGAAGPGGQATVIAYAAQSVEIRASAPAGGWLVLADTADPGWQASVDGRPAPVYLADYALRAVALPPGHHLVRFTYAPRAFSLGLAISLAAAALAATLLLAPLVRRH
jgi:hypothetical protein